jgi:hypothetical protein
MSSDVPSSSFPFTSAIGRFKGVATLYAMIVYFFTFCDNKSMIDYETMNKLMHFLDVKKIPKINSSNTIG